jgi:hypothetical protein
MNDQPDSDVGNLDVDLARRIEVACRRFEADLVRRTPTARRE